MAENNGYYPQATPRLANMRDEYQAYQQQAAKPASAFNFQLPYASQGYQPPSYSNMNFGGSGGLSYGTDNKFGQYQNLLDSPTAPLSGYNRALAQDAAFNTGLANQGWQGGDATSGIGDLALTQAVPTPSPGFFDGWGDAIGGAATSVGQFGRDIGFSDTIDPKTGEVTNEGWGGDALAYLELGFDYLQGQKKVEQFDKMYDLAFTEGYNNVLLAQNEIDDRQARRRSANPGTQQEAIQLRQV